jgi:hypothetical protein
MTAGFVVAADPTAVHSDGAHTGPPLSVHSVGVHMPDTFAQPRKRDTSERLPECRPSRNAALARGRAGVLVARERRSAPLSRSSLTPPQVSLAEFDRSQ